MKLLKGKICDVCKMGTQTKGSFNSKHHISASRPSKLLRMGLFGPTRIRNIEDKIYALIVFDDFSRFSGVFFFPTNQKLNSQAL